MATQSSPRDISSPQIHLQSPAVRSRMGGLSNKSSFRSYNFLQSQNKDKESETPSPKKSYAVSPCLEIPEQEPVLKGHSKPSRSSSVSSHTKDQVDQVQFSLKPILKAASQASGSQHHLTVISEQVKDGSQAANEAINLNIQKKIEENQFLNRTRVSVKRKSYSSDNFSSLMSQVNLEKAAAQHVDQTQETPQLHHQALLGIPGQEERNDRANRVQIIMEEPEESSPQLPMRQRLMSVPHNPIGNQLRFNLQKAAHLEVLPPPKEINRRFSSQQPSRRDLSASIARLSKRSSASSISQSMISTRPPQKVGILEKAQMFLKKAFNSNNNPLKQGVDSGAERSGRKEKSKKSTMTTILTHTKPPVIFEKPTPSPDKQPALRRTDHGIEGEDESAGGTFHILNKQNTRLKLYEKRVPPKRKASSSEHLHHLLKDSYANLIFERQNINSRQYLKDLYENTPIFDEIPPTYGEQKNPWMTISTFLISPFQKDHDKFLKYISQSYEYRDQVESKDALVKLTSTRRKKMLNEREARFPFTYQKVKRSELKKMEKEFRQKMNRIKIKREHNREIHKHADKALSGLKDTLASRIADARLRTFQQRKSKKHSVSTTQSALGDVNSPNDDASENSVNTIKTKFKFGLRRTRTRQFKKMIQRQFANQQNSATRKKRRKKRRNNSDTSETSDEEEMLQDAALLQQLKSEKHPSISVKDEDIIDVEYLEAEEEEKKEAAAEEDEDTVNKGEVVQSQDEVSKITHSHDLSNTHRQSMSSSSDSESESSSSDSSSSSGSSMTSSSNSDSLKSNLKSIKEDDAEQETVHDMTPNKKSVHLGFRRSSIFQRRPSIFRNLHIPDGSPHKTHMKNKRNSKNFTAALKAGRKSIDHRGTGAHLGIPQSAAKVPISKISERKSGDASPRDRSPGSNLDLLSVKGGSRSPNLVQPNSGTLPGYQRRRTSIGPTIGLYHAKRLLPHKKKEKKVKPGMIPKAQEQKLKHSSTQLPKISDNESQSLSSKGELSFGDRSKFRRKKSMGSLEGRTMKDLIKESLTKLAQEQIETAHKQAEIEKSMSLDLSTVRQDSEDVRKRHREQQENQVHLMMNILKNQSLVESKILEEQTNKNLLSEKKIKIKREENQVRVEIESPTKLPREGSSTLNEKTPFSLIRGGNNLRSDDAGTENPMLVTRVIKSSISSSCRSSSADKSKRSKSGFGELHDNVSPDERSPEKSPDNPRSPVEEKLQSFKNFTNISKVDIKKHEDKAKEAKPEFSTLGDALTYISKWTKQKSTPASTKGGQGHRRQQKVQSGEFSARNASSSLPNTRYDNVSQKGSIVSATLAKIFKGRKHSNEHESRMEGESIGSMPLYLDFSSSLEKDEASTPFHPPPNIISIKEGSNPRDHLTQKDETQISIGPQQESISRNEYSLPYQFDRRSSSIESQNNSIVRFVSTSKPKSRLGFQKKKMSAQSKSPWNLSSNINNVSVKLNILEKPTARARLQMGDNRKSLVIQSNLSMKEGSFFNSSAQDGQTKEVTSFGGRKPSQESEEAALPMFQNKSALNLFSEQNTSKDSYPNSRRVFRHGKVRHQGEIAATLNSGTLSGLDKIDEQAPQKCESVAFEKKNSISANFNSSEAKKLLNKLRVYRSSVYSNKTIKAKSQKQSPARFRLFRGLPKDQTSAQGDEQQQLDTLKAVTTKQNDMSSIGNESSIEKAFSKCSSPDGIIVPQVDLQHLRPVRPSTNQVVIISSKEKKEKDEPSLQISEPQFNDEKKSVLSQLQTTGNDYVLANSNRRLKNFIMRQSKNIMRVKKYEEKKKIHVPSSKGTTLAPPESLAPSTSLQTILGKMQTLQEKMVQESMMKQRKNQMTLAEENQVSGGGGSEPSFFGDSITSLQDPSIYSGIATSANHPMRSDMAVKRGLHSSIGSREQRRSIPLNQPMSSMSHQPRLPAQGIASRTAKMLREVGGPSGATSSLADRRNLQIARRRLVLGHSEFVTKRNSGIQ